MPANAHDLYEEIVVSLFTRIDKMKGVKLTREAAMVCYQAYANNKYDYQKFAERHEETAPWEAAVARSIADMLMIQSGNPKLTEEDIKAYYGS